jgi:hypothetical protein
MDRHGGVKPVPPEFGHDLIQGAGVPRAVIIPEHLIHMRVSGNDGPDVAPHQHRHRDPRMRAVELGTDGESENDISEPVGPDDKDTVNRNDIPLGMLEQPFALRVLG